MEPVTLGFGAVFLTGLVFGAGPCNITCLPYLGPVLLTRDGGVRHAWRTVVPFSAGRLAGYAALGAAAGQLGRVAGGWLEGRAALLLGIAAIVLGLLFLFPRRRRVCPGGAAPGRRGVPLGLFGMGAAMALNPCAPLGTVMLAAAATGDPLAGLGLGLGFGLGAVLIPTALFATLVAHLGAQLRDHLRQWRGALERSAGVLLVLMGTLTATGWVQP